MDADCTLVIPMRGASIFLAEKRDKIGQGQLNFYGGKFEKYGDMDIVHCAMREFAEESTAVTNEEYLKLAAQVAFYRGESITFVCRIYVCTYWFGTLQATPQMGEPKEYPISDPPYERMMRGDRFWLPLVLAGDPPFKASLWYSPDMKTVEKFEVHGPL